MNFLLLSLNGLAWISLASTLGCYLFFVWKAAHVSGWLWAAACLVVPIPGIPIFAYLHWPEMRVIFLATAGFFAVMAACMITIMAVGSR